MEINPSWLTKQTTYEDAIRDNMFDGKEFGHSNDDWERLKAEIRPGDEFGYFEPPADTKEIRFWGLALVRAGRVVSTVIQAVD